MNIFFRKVHKVQGREKVPLKFAAEPRELLRWGQVLLEYKLGTHGILNIEERERSLKIREAAKQLLKQLDRIAPVPHIPDEEIRRILDKLEVQEGDREAAELLLQRRIHKELLRRRVMMSGAALNKYLEKIRQLSTGEIPPEAHEVLYGGMQRAAKRKKK